MSARSRIGAGRGGGEAGERNAGHRQPGLGRRRRCPQLCMCHHADGFQAAKALLPAAAPLQQILADSEGNISKQSGVHWCISRCWLHAPPHLLRRSGGAGGRPQAPRRRPAQERMVAAAQRWAATRQMLRAAPGGRREQKWMSTVVVAALPAATPAALPVAPAGSLQQCFKSVECLAWH